MPWLLLVPPRLGSEAYKTTTVPRTLNPKWHQTMVFTIQDPNDKTLHFNVFDEDRTKSHDGMGECTYNIGTLLLDHKKPVSLNLRPEKDAAHKTTSRGSLYVRLEIVDEPGLTH